jgi:23S rRNA (cytosine1962-C5)-methyltransferase
LSELLIGGEPFTPSQVLGQLARIGHPVLGDLRRGGILSDGGLRFWPLETEAAARSAQRPPGWWPKEPALLAAAPVQGDGAPVPPFAVSQATRRALRRGHPWVLRDSETDEAARFAAGALVRIATNGDGPGEVFARVEDGGLVSARVWSRSVDDPVSLEARVASALRRRQSLRRASSTDALRLVHGEADGLPGLSIDRLGPLLRVLIGGRAAESIAKPALDCVCETLRDEIGPDPSVVEVLHLRDRPPGRFECVRLARGSRDLVPERLQVSERGIAFWVEPGLSRPERSGPGTGLYLDQRENRARLARRARRGGRWLNLFAHTGAFSLALLDAGAEEVISVDQSSSVLRWLEANLELNPRLDVSRHRCVRADGRYFLGTGTDRFDGIVIDPPTAAAGGRGYWKLERDLPPLVEAGLKRLAAGGTLFVSRNDRRRRHTAVELVRSAADRAEVALATLEAAPPGVDYPRLRGFPEGDSFDAAIALLR